MIGKNNSYIVDPAENKKVNIELAGYKGIAFSKVNSKDFKTSPGFILSSLAFDDFLIAGNLVDKIIPELKRVKPFIKQSAQFAARNIQSIIFDTKIPDTIIESILKEYKTLGGGGKCFVEAQLSPIIESTYFPENVYNYTWKDIKGDLELISTIKEIWMQMFSIEAIELRANGYYKGAISTAVIIKKMIKAEVSGFAYSIPPITKIDNIIEINAIYGMNDNRIDLLNSYDVYMVDVKTGKVKEKTILPQSKMIIQTGHNNDASDYTAVEISKEWQSKQKIDDKKIEEIASTVKKVESKLKSPVKVVWAIEAGEIIVEDIETVKNTKTIKPKEVDKNFASEKIIKLKNENEEKVKLKQIESEIIKMSQESDAQSLYTSIPKPAPKVSIPEKRRRQQVPTWSQKYKIKSQMLLNVSSFNSGMVNSIDYFEGCMLDGTETVLDLGVLPENEFDEVEKMRNMIEAFAIDITTVSRNLGGSKLIYQFSNITESELKLLGVEDTKDIYTGDERFIANPKAFVTEIEAVKSAKTDYLCDNISVSFPAIRNSKNLASLKTIVSSRGLRRSTLTKFYAEVAFPSFAFEITEIDEKLVDGLIINYDMLVAMSVYKNKPSDADHKSMVNTIESILKAAKNRKLETAVRIDAYNIRFLPEILKFDPDIVIWNSMPTDVEMQKLLR